MVRVPPSRRVAGPPVPFEGGKDGTCPQGTQPCGLFTCIASDGMALRGQLFSFSAVEMPSSAPVPPQRDDNRDHTEREGCKPCRDLQALFRRVGASVSPPGKESLLPHLERVPHLEREEGLDCSPPPPYIVLGFWTEASC